MESLLLNNKTFLLPKDWNKAIFQNTVHLSDQVMDMSTENIHMTELLHITINDEQL